MKDIRDRGYSNPQYLVSTDWVDAHLSDPNVCLVESNEDPNLFPSGHIVGAIEIDWTRDLHDPVRRDYLDRDRFQDLMRKIGADEDTTIVFYGDKHNWWACYAFWVFQLFGHNNARIMDGGRLKWIKENRMLEREINKPDPSYYVASERDDLFDRAFRDDVLNHIESRLPIVDVRSPEEYKGSRLHMPGYPNEGALRGGHIPSARNIPWQASINSENGTFKSFDELHEIYNKENNLKKDDSIIVYCRIGERSSHTWFVMKYLLGFENVRNYDGSWTEWGNLVGVPIECY